MIGTGSACREMAAGLGFGLAALFLAPLPALGDAAPLLHSPLLHPVFQDHGVLQHGRPVPVWGMARPGETVTVRIGQASATARAGRDGRWQATLPALAPGGPFTLTARTATAEQSAADMLVGDVYLCAGQSNMELQVHRSLDARNETSRANHPHIRYLSVDKAVADAPAYDFTMPVSWRAVTPQTAPDMSAVCYFFGREMRKLADVPVGLIASAWGGSMIEAWMATDDLRRQGDYATALDHQARHRRGDGAGVRGFITDWQDWWGRTAAGRPWAEPPGGGEGWRAAPATFKPWESWGVPEMADYNGLAWMRAGIALTAEQARDAVALRLGPVDDLDVTWVNGQPLGSQYGPGDPRRYPLPAGLLRPGENTITLAILDGYGDGGLYGSTGAQAVELADGTLIPLRTPWEYKATPVDTAGVPRAPWGTVDGLSRIHNAMLAPIGPYGLRAAIWYQGESNSARPEKYQSLLAGMMAGWRRQFGPDLPFLIVQLPEWGYPAAGTPVESNWARLRWSQRAAVDADGNAALAVAIGLGDWYDIHPANKQQVARRLAHAARSLLLGQDVPPSGPVPLGASRQGGMVTVRFTGITGALQSLSGHRPVGFELCDAAPGTCRYVDATLTGDTVTLAAGDGPAVRVRYCWADSPVCTLYDTARLPAGPFELPVR